jgi:hypothetical protein
MKLNKKLKILINNKNNTMFKKVILRIKKELEEIEKNIKDNITHLPWINIIKQLQMQKKLLNQLL